MASERIKEGREKLRQCLHLLVYGAPEHIALSECQEATVTGTGPPVSLLEH